MPKVSLLVRLENSYYLCSISSCLFAICNVYFNARSTRIYHQATAMLIKIMTCSIQTDIMLRKGCVTRLTAAMKDAHTRIRGRGSPCRTETSYVSFVIVA